MRMPSIITWHDRKLVQHNCDVYILLHLFESACFCIIAERLSARQLIVQCGLKSQLAHIYMCATSITLRNAIKSPVTFLIRVITMSVRSVYVLLLQL